MTTNTPKILEKTTCGRCGGSGEYSYNQINGRVCFGCGGSGEALTKRGKAVSAWLSARLTTDALSVQPGDRVQYVDAWAGKRHTFTVAAVEEGDPIKGARLDPATGDMIPTSTRSVDLVTTDGKRHGFGGAIPLRRVVTDADRAAARDYRDSLTMAGKPRKRAAR